MAVPYVSHNHNTPEIPAMDSCFVLKHGCPSTWKGQKGIYLKKGKELHLGTELTPPPPPLPRHSGGNPKSRGAKPPGSRVVPCKSRVFSLLYAPLSDECHCQIVSRVIIHDSNASLWKKRFVCTIIYESPCLLPSGSTYVTSAISDFVTALTFLKGFKILRHSLVARSQRNGSSEELDAAVDYFCFYFPVVQRPQLCFAYRRYERRTDQRTNWQLHSGECKGKSMNSFQKWQRSNRE